MHISYTPTKTKTLRLISKATSLTCVHTLYNSTNINTNTPYQIYQYYMYTYPLQQQNIKKIIIYKLPSLTCKHTLNKNTNINTKYHWENYKSSMCKYYLQQHKHQHTGSLPKMPSNTCVKTF